MRTCAVLFFSLSLAGGDAGEPAQPAPPTTNRIEGQIYITQRNRQTVKMSLVTVRVVDAKNADATMARALGYRNAKKQDEDWRNRAEALARGMPKMSAADRAKAAETFATLRTLLISNTPFVKLGSASIFELLNSMDWQPMRTVQTDADGNFSAEVPAGSWTLVALSRRKIVDEDEEYIWVVPVRPGERMLLNNANLLGERGRR